MYRPRTAVASAVALVFTLGACQEAPSAPEGDVATGASPSATAKHRADADLFIDAVPLQPGVTADIHVQLFVNEGMPCSGTDRTALFLPGSSHTANTFSLVAEEMFRGPRETRMCQVAAVNFPGHGQSSLPQGDLLFGDLTLQHYLATVTGVLDRLSGHGVSPGAIVGHSQGTMVVQMLQAELVAEGTSLRDAHGIRRAVLLSPNLPAELPWRWRSNPALLELIQRLVTVDPELGQYIRGPAWAFRRAWFLDLTGAVAPLAPSATTIAGNGWNSKLPLVANLQTLGSDPFSRPSIPAGIFADGEGTELQIVSNADDPASLPSEGEALLRYLTGAPDARNTVVVDPTGSHSATHSAMLIEELADDVRTAIDLPRRP